MIYGNNHNDKKLKDVINQKLDKPYTFVERIKLGGNGSPRLSIESYSNQLNQYFGESSERKFVNVELRKKGILVYIKNNINNYVWVIPYYQLSVFQSGTFNIHAHGLFVKIHIAKQHPSIKKFINKLVRSYQDFYSQYQTIDDL